MTVNRDWTRRHELLFRTQISGIYHRKRERHFEWWDRATKAASIFAATSALSRALSQSPELMTTVLAASAAFSTISLVFGIADRARRHADMASRWIQLGAKITSAGEYDFGSQLDTWGAEAEALEALEPPSLDRLVIACQNELALAMGHPEKVRPIAWYQRPFMQFLSMPLHA